MDATARAEALAQLAALGVTNDLTTATDEPKLALTGDEVYAGGDVVRVLIRPAHLPYREEKGGELNYAEAKVGDTVLLDEAQAKRLDGLGATMTKAAATKATKAEPVAVPSVPEEQSATADTQTEPVVQAPAPTGEPATVTSTGGKTDEELGAMNAGELVAHVNQHNEDKARVRALEMARTQPRSTVLKATSTDDPDEELD